MKPRPALLIVALAVPFLALAFAWRFASPILNTDSATGLLVWESMAGGSPWNSRLAPDPADLARDHVEFVSWWSPGQYVFPGLIHVFGFTWCHAALLMTLASILLGICLVWTLGRRLGLGPQRSALACLLTAAAGGSLHGFGMFWGGDILLIAACPLVYLAALRTREGAAASGAALFFSACLGALFCKHSATLAIAGALLFLGVESVWERGRRCVFDSRLWLAVGAAALAIACSRLLWVQGGPTAGDSGQADQPALVGLAYALNGPWFALTGAGNLGSWLMQRGGLAHPEDFERFAGWLLIPGLSGTTLVAWLGLRRHAPREWRLAACAWLAVACLLAFLYLHGASVSLDERHFRPAVAPLALALSAAAIPSKQGSRGHLLALAVVGFALLLGVAAHARRVRLLAELPRGAVSGFAQPDLSAEAAALIARTLAPGATLVLASPSHAMEFPGRRVHVSDAFFRSREELSRWRLNGFPDALELAVPASFDLDGRGEQLRAAFSTVPPGAWHKRQAAEWNVWSASPANPPPP